MITEIRAKQEEFMQPVTALLGVLVFASYLGNQCLDWKNEQQFLEIDAIPFHDVFGRFACSVIVYGKITKNRFNLKKKIILTFVDCLIQVKIPNNPFPAK